MILETKIKKFGNKLVIILPKSAIKKAELIAGDHLEINIRGRNMTIARIESSPKKIIEDVKDDIYSKTLREEQLILAK
jgi:antitoxin component of MazEF toxin-antitoxin module